MERNITITESLFISRAPETVWDFTQDYTRRPQWDATILAAEVIGREAALLLIGQPPRYPRHDREFE